MISKINYPDSNVSEYIKMDEGFDGKELIAVLKQHLPEGSSVLELGMGPGKDLDILSKTYKATGSDSSQVFLDLYKEKHPDADIMLLDAVSIETSKVFDCIYSNKVFVHLTTDELQQSLINQKKVLKKNGLLFHSFWYGDKQEEFNRLFFQYYTGSTLTSLIGSAYEIVDIQRYTEMEEDDSLYIILRK